MSAETVSTSNYLLHCVDDGVNDWFVDCVVQMQHTGACSGPLSDNFSIERHQRHGVCSSADAVADKGHRLRIARIRTRSAFHVAYEHVGQMVQSKSQMARQTQQPACRVHTTIAVSIAGKGM